MDFAWALRTEKWLNLELALVPATILDIDFFKKINDRLGHKAGDITLQDLVNHLKRRIRKTDTLYRMGGEEFILLLRDTELEASVDIAESLRESIAKIMIKDSEHNLTVSIGVSCLAPKITYTQWLNNVDKLLYEAKQLGRNRVVS